MTTTAAVTTEVAPEMASSTVGRHAGAPADVDREADLVMERLAEAGVPSGLPAGLGDNQGILVLGAHRADEDGSTSLAAAPRGTVSHLPWRLVLTSVLAVLVVLALAFVALDGLASAWSAGGRPA